MFHTEVHTALGGVRIRCFYLQGVKKYFKSTETFYATKFMLNNFTLIFQEPCNDMVQKNVTA
jgi:hypothetical protein